MQATIHNEFLTLTVDTHGAEAVSLKNAAGEAGGRERQYLDPLCGG